MQNKMGLIILFLLDLERWVFYLQLQHEIHPLFSQRVNIVKDECYDDVYTVTLMTSNSILK